MGDFSATWLRLREPVDLRSRNRRVADALHEEFAARPAIRAVDLGCGAGANLRATAPLLGPRQHWTLLDNDAALLDRAREDVAGWADAAASTPEGLVLSRGGQTITVQFRQADIAQDAARHGALGDTVDLVTASAFFDLVSPAFIETLVAATARRSAALYAVLTFNGLQDWSPPHAADERIRRAFNAHQGRDKGFGPAAGPQATALLAGAFGAAGYRVTSGDSPWRIGPGDDALLLQLDAGVAAAVAETGLLDPAALAAWQAHRRSGAQVGHADLLALPPR